MRGAVAVVGLKNGAKNLPGKIVFLGTPAEEGGGGKIILLDKGAMNGVDAAMMAHPFDAEACTMPALATQSSQLPFTARPHTRAAAPWDGASALSAVIQTFQSVDAARVHIRDGRAFHGIITDGGQAVNIIPGKTECQFLVRGKTSKYTGEIARPRACDVPKRPRSRPARRFDICHRRLQELINNRAMALHYASHSEILGTVSREAPEIRRPAAPIWATLVMRCRRYIRSFSDVETWRGNCHEDAFVGMPIRNMATRR